ncbi:MAG: hypothetical protein FJ038_00835 [Chloroflexi bacterium]|nr:hypothetical protein [Chloroflexota bacterium]
MAWELAYAHDAAGLALEGSRADLIEAIEHGAEVRVFVDYAPVPGCYKEAQATWVKDGHVYVQNTASVGCAFTPEYAWGSGSAVDPAFTAGGLRFLDDAYHYFEILSTTGDADESRWNVGEHRLRARNQAKYPMRWFVRR